MCTAHKWQNITYNTIARRVKELENVLLLGWFEGNEHKNFKWLSTLLLGASIPPTALRDIKAAVLDETPRPMWARRTTVFENQAELECSDSGIVSALGWLITQHRCGSMAL